MLLTKYLNPKNDFAFKRIFGTPRNQDILIHFINDMLGLSGAESIKTVTFLQTIQDPEIAAAKQSSVDVMCTDEHGVQYIVEMQVARGEGFAKRAQYYAAKAYSRQLMKRGIYANLKEIIFVAITDFIMFPEKVDYKSDHVVLDKKTFSHDLKDFYFTFLELPKFNKSINELSNVVEKWAYFFKHADETKDEELTQLIGSDLVIKRAYDELNRFSWSQIELNTYEQEEKRELDAIAISNFREAEGMARGMAKGIEKGIEKGIAAALIEIIDHKFGRLLTQENKVCINNKINTGNTEELTLWLNNVLDIHEIEPLFELFLK